MDDAEVLARVLGLLKSANIPYMVTGSIASSTYGEARSTQDLDVIVDPSSEQLHAFLLSLDPQRYYFSREAAGDALAQKSMFNVIDFQTGWKIDLILLRADAFEQAKFKRRVMSDVLGQPTEIVTAEDSILSKLEWRKGSRSDRQYRDAAQVAANQWNALEFEYLRQSAATLDLSEDLEQLLHDAEALRPS